MGVEKYIYGTAIFSLFILMGLAFIIDIDSNYTDVDLSTSSDFFGEKYNVTNSTNTLGINMKDDVLSGDFDTADAENSLFSGAFNSIRKITELFRLVGEIINDVAQVLGINPVFTMVAVGLMALAVAYSIILLIFRIRG